MAGALSPLAVGPSPARAGGSPIGFVSLPVQGKVAVVTLPSAGTFARIPVPGRPGQVAASVNGRRVLVVSPDEGTVMEIDGILHKAVRVFRGFGRPVDVVFDYEPPIGLVTPRYAYVLDQAPAGLPHPGGASSPRRTRARSTEPPDRRGPRRDAVPGAGIEGKTPVATPLPAGIRAIDVYGGSLVGTLPRSLILLAVPDGSMRTSMPFGTSIGGFAWSVL
jgi:hypothetical protein